MSSFQVTVLLPTTGPHFDRAAKKAEADIRRAFPTGGTRVGSVALPVVYGWYRSSKKKRLEWDKTLMVTIAVDLPDGDPQKLIARLVRFLNFTYSRPPIWQDSYSISVVSGYFRFPRGVRPEADMEDRNGPRLLGP